MSDTTLHVLAAIGASSLVLAGFSVLVWLRDQLDAWLDRLAEHGGAKVYRRGLLRERQEDRLREYAAMVQAERLRVMRWRRENAGPWGSTITWPWPQWPGRNREGNT